MSLYHLLHFLGIRRRSDGSLSIFGKSTKQPTFREERRKIPDRRNQDRRSLHGRSAISADGSPGRRRSFGRRSTDSFKGSINNIVSPNH